MSVCPVGWRIVSREELEQLVLDQRRVIDALEVRICEVEKALASRGGRPPRPSKNSHHPPSRDQKTNRPDGRGATSVLHVRAVPAAWWSVRIGSCSSLRRPAGIAAAMSLANGKSAGIATTASTFRSWPPRSSPRRSQGRAVRWPLWPLRPAARGRAGRWHADRDAFRPDHSCASALSAPHPPCRLRAAEPVLGRAVRGDDLPGRHRPPPSTGGAFGRMAEPLDELRRRIKPRRVQV